MALTQCLWCTKKKVFGRYGPEKNLCKTHWDVYRRSEWAQNMYDDIKQKRETDDSRYYEDLFRLHSKYCKQTTRMYHLYNNVTMFRKNVCAKKIQNAWRRCIANPEYNVCKQRLQREFNEMI